MKNKYKDANHHSLLQLGMYNNLQPGLIHFRLLVRMQLREKRFSPIHRGTQQLSSYFLN
jgi:hypothetical protein